ncbi:MAG: hypothetical protein ACM3PP_02270 [Candidatus Saccharibacteria bacterium]
MEKAMPTYKIADLIVDLQASGKTLARQSPQYLDESSHLVNFTIALSEGFLRQKQYENPHLSLDECEYIWTGADFYRRLLDYNGFMLHASALAYEGRSYLFSAPCGTGKSTHARQWQEHFGNDKVQIVNDDKPAIRLIDDCFYVFGTPWSGKSEFNVNVQVPLQAICFLEQSPFNWIEKLQPKAALKLLFNQTLRPGEALLMDNLLTLLDKLIRQIPIYKMGCNISKEAAVMAYRAMISGCTAGL